MKTGIKNNNIQKVKAASGFTLVEIMLVVAIIGVLAALVIPKISGDSQHAREVAVQADIRGGLKSALDHYNVDMGTYPASLQDLLTPPRKNAVSWRGPYLDPALFPQDPWKNPYQYSYPGKHATIVSYDLWSVGPDGNNPIGNWQAD
jgi:general secretion pathway protein G